MPSDFSQEQADHSAAVPQSEKYSTWKPIIVFVFIAIFFLDSPYSAVPSDFPQEQADHYAAVPQSKQYSAWKPIESPHYVNVDVNAV